MRMWMVNPKVLCNNHLLGEHAEIHKHRHNFVKKHRIDGRIFPIVQIEPHNMESRHNELAVEMLERGMNHKSPFEQPDVSHLDPTLKVDRDYSISDLKTRCTKCKELIENIITE